jgi:hypothetical protein
MLKTTPTRTAIDGNKLRGGIAYPFLFWCCCVSAAKQMTDLRFFAVPDT